MRALKFDQRGMSLMELMVAIGVMSVVLMAGGSISTMTASQTQAIRARENLNELGTRLRQRIQFSNLCHESLSGVDLATADDITMNVPGIGSGPLGAGDLIKGVADPMAGAGVNGGRHILPGMGIRILNLKLADVTVLEDTHQENGTTQVMANLVLSASLLNQSGEVTGGSTFRALLIGGALLIRDDASNTIVGCSGTAGSDMPGICEKWGCNWDTATSTCDCPEYSIACPNPTDVAIRLVQGTNGGTVVDCVPLGGTCPDGTYAVGVAPGRVICAKPPDPVVKHNCAAETDLMWTVGANTCRSSTTSPLPRARDGSAPIQTVDSQGDSNGYYGDAWFQCVDGDFILQAGPAPTCTAQFCNYPIVPWGGGCAAFPVSMAHGTSSVFGNRNSGYSGSATLNCNNGVITTSGESCTQDPINCSAQVQNWAPGCSATVALNGGQSGIVFPNTAGGFTGTASFSCSNLGVLSMDGAPAPICVANPVNCSGVRTWGAANECSAVVNLTDGQSAVPVFNTAAGQTGVANFSCAAGSLTMDGAPAPTCAPQTACWAETTTPAPGLTCNVAGSCPVSGGTIVASCDISGVWTPTTLTCTDVPGLGDPACAIFGAQPTDCANQTVTWGVGPCTYTGTVTDGTVGQWITNSLAGYTGAAQVDCNAGTLSAPYNASCTPNAPPPGGDCGPSLRTWGTNCSATVTLTNGQSGIVFANTAPGYTGSGDFSCLNGVLSGPASYTCGMVAPPPSDPIFSDWVHKSIASCPAPNPLSGEMQDDNNDNNYNGESRHHTGEDQDGYTTRLCVGGSITDVMWSNGTVNAFGYLDRCPAGYHYTGLTDDGDGSHNMNEDTSSGSTHYYCVQGIAWGRWERTSGAIPGCPAGLHHLGWIWKDDAKSGNLNNGGKQNLDDALCLKSAPKGCGGEFQCAGATYSTPTSSCSTKGLAELNHICDRGANWYQNSTGQYTCFSESGTFQSCGAGDTTVNCVCD